ncbi:MAG: GatB/YqeY domain-containing protein [Gemmatimonadetes bacterium]|nr:MAG: GatB/YqeY domain-containing protein [Gemmatimonadota bacterium]
MSTLKDRIQADLNAARKARDRVRTLVLSTILADLRNREIELGGTLDDDGVLQVLGKGIKQRRDAAEQARAAGRGELADQEEAQIAILETYLPPPLSEADVRALVREAIEAGATEMGQVMGRVMPALRGRFDGREANRIVREELGS